MSNAEAWWERHARPIGDWHSKGLCAEIGGEFHFPDKGQGDYTRIAKSICARCPVTFECGEYALSVPGMMGIWGGMTEGERRRAQQRKVSA